MAKTEKINVQEMVGNSYTFQNRRYKILKIEQGDTEDYWDVTTDRGNFSVFTETLIKEFYSETGLLRYKEAREQSFAVVGDNSNLDLVTEALKKMLQDVKNDPQKIPQATTMNEIAKSIIDVEKVKLVKVKLAFEA